MRGDRAAEILLSMFTSRERAAATIGDMLEEAGTRGPLWFWEEVAGTCARLLWRGLAAAPASSMLTTAALTWFVYMFTTLVVAAMATALVTAAWPIFYVFVHHTALELIVSTGGSGWSTPPPPVLRAVEAGVMAILVPFTIGRGASFRWPGMEIVAGVVVIVVWSAMAVAVPFVGFFVSARALMPLIATCVLAGAVTRRYAAITAP